MKVNYSYVRSCKKRDLEKRYMQFKKEDELHVLECENATILPLKKFPEDHIQFGRGGVIDSNGNYIAESASPNRVEGKYEATPIVKDETVVYCGYLNLHWGHFLIETIVRLWYLLEERNEIEKYVFTDKIDASSELKGNFREFFELFGILNKIEIINQPITYKKVYIPERSFTYNQSYSIQYKKIFDHIIQKAITSNSIKVEVDKVFLSRSKFKKAQYAEAGLDMLDHYFEKNGYKVVYPEEISLTELIVLLQNAKECAAESGTVPHNILFGYDGQKLTIVDRQTVLNPTQVYIDIVRNLDVTYIDGHATIYPVSHGFGPYIFLYNKQFDEFTKARAYSEPDSYYTSDAYLKKCVRQYMAVYKKTYYYAWGIEDWMIQYADTIYEAYDESMELLGPYIRGNKRFRLSQITEVGFAKMFIKKIIGRE